MGKSGPEGRGKSRRTTNEDEDELNDAARRPTVEKKKTGVVKDGLGGLAKALNVTSLETPTQEEDTLLTKVETVTVNGEERTLDELTALFSEIKEGVSTNPKTQNDEKIKRWLAICRPRLQAVEEAMGKGGLDEGGLQTLADDVEVFIKEINKIGDRVEILNKLKDPEPATIPEVDSLTAAEDSKIEAENEVFDHLRGDFLSIKERLGKITVGTEETNLPDLVKKAEGKGIEVMRYSKRKNNRDLERLKVLIGEFEALVTEAETLSKATVKTMETKPGPKTKKRSKEVEMDLDKSDVELLAEYRTPDEIKVAKEKKLAKEKRGSATPPEIIAKEKQYPSGDYNEDVTIPSAKEIANAEYDSWPKGLQAIPAPGISPEEKLYTAYFASQGEYVNARAEYLNSRRKHDTAFQKIKAKLGIGLSSRALAETATLEKQTLMEGKESAYREAMKARLRSELETRRSEWKRQWTVRTRGTLEERNTESFQEHLRTEEAKFLFEESQREHGTLAERMIASQPQEKRGWTSKALKMGYNALTWTPKTKKYQAIYKYARISAGVAAGTGIAFAAGTVGAAGVAGYAGYRMAKSVALGMASPAINKALMGIGNESANRTLAKRMEKAGASAVFDKFDEFHNQTGEALRRHAKAKKLVRLASLAGTGAIVGYASLWESAHATSLPGGTSNEPLQTNPGDGLNSDGNPIVGESAEGAVGGKFPLGDENFTANPHDATEGESAVGGIYVDNSINDSFNNYNTAPGCVNPFDFEQPRYGNPLTGRNPSFDLTQPGEGTFGGPRLNSDGNPIEMEPQGRDWVRPMDDGIYPDGGGVENPNTGALDGPEGLPGRDGIRPVDDGTYGDGQTGDNFRNPNESGRGGDTRDNFPNPNESDRRSQPDAPERLPDGGDDFTRNRPSFQPDAPGMDGNRPMDDGTYGEIEDNGTDLNRDYDVKDNGTDLMGEAEGRDVLSTTESATIGKNGNLWSTMKGVMKADPEKFGYNPDSKIPLDKWLNTRVENIRVAQPDIGKLSLVHSGDKVYLTPDANGGLPKIGFENGSGYRAGVLGERGVRAPVTKIGFIPEDNIGSTVGKVPVVQADPSPFKTAGPGKGAWGRWDPTDTETVQEQPPAPAGGERAHIIPDQEMALRLDEIEKRARSGQLERIARGITGLGESSGIQFGTLEAGLAERYFGGAVGGAVGGVTGLDAFNALPNVPVSKLFGTESLRGSGYETAIQELIKAGDKFYPPIDDNLLIQEYLKALARKGTF